MCSDTKGTSFVYLTIMGNRCRKCIGELSIWNLSTNQIHLKIYDSIVVPLLPSVGIKFDDGGSGEEMRRILPSDPVGRVARMVLLVAEEDAVESEEQKFPLEKI